MQPVILVPGVFVITALQGAQQTSMGFAADLAEGVTDRSVKLTISGLVPEVTSAENEHTSAASTA